MPFIRYTRDKRGYETTYVVHGYRPTQEANRTRVLYLFRSPSNLAVGRRALDDEARVALEHTHPDLSFDWQALGRDAMLPREPPPKPWREARDSRPQRSVQPVQSKPAPPTVTVIVDDQSVLGHTLGAPEAARLRARYGELIQRIQRRARSPEERDQLAERARRLNPDDWADATAVRAGVSTAEAEWESLAEALPQRRRGRRGGRRRDGVVDSQRVETSAIMEGKGDVDESAEDGQVAVRDRDPGPGGHDDRLGPAGSTGPAGDVSDSD